MYLCPHSGIPKQEENAILIGKLRWKKRLAIVAIHFFLCFLFFFKRLLPQVNSACIEVEMVKILFDI